MPVAGGTTVGPLTTETRDMLKEWKEENGYPNYNEAVKALLEDAERGDP